MKVLVIYHLDEVVTEDRIEAGRIRCKILRDGRAYVQADEVLHLYRRVEKIVREPSS